MQIVFSNGRKITNEQNAEMTLLKKGKSQMRLTTSAVILCLTAALTGCGQSAGEAALCDKKKSLIARVAIGLSDTVNGTTSGSQLEQTMSDVEELRRVLNEIQVRKIECKN